MTANLSPHEFLPNLLHHRGRSREIRAAARPCCSVGQQKPEERSEAVPKIERGFPRFCDTEISPPPPLVWVSRLLLRWFNDRDVGLCMLQIADWWNS